MKDLITYILIFVGLSCIYTYAGGDPEFVKLPNEYKKEYAQYSNTNRDGKEQLAKIYANDIALSSIKKGDTTAPGSIIVMEIYKIKRDDKNSPSYNEDGIYKADSIAAIAVMEKRDSWDKTFPKDHRLNNWGFAFYNPDGTVKKNDLACVACHTPLKNADFLFSYNDLKNYANLN